MDYHANVEFPPVQEQRKIGFEKFVHRWSICLAVIEPSEETHLGGLDIQPQDPTTPIEDINVVITSWEKGINCRRLGRHEEREKAFDEL
jgi:hypothetical protein